MAENINDKGYRRMLSDKRNFLDLVKNHIAAPWADQIGESDLELIDKRFVTKDFRDREADIVYRAKVGGRDAVFYVLLELQSEVDFTMPFRLLVYMVELMRRLFAAEKPEARERKGFRLPAIVPIVLYNGAGAWSCVRSFKEYLAGYELFAPNIIDFEYVMINVNEPDEAELVKMPTLVNLVMLADKKGDPESVMRRLRVALALAGRLTVDEQLQLKGWILDVLLGKAKGKLGKEDAEEIRGLFERKEAADVTYALEMALDEIERRGRREGKREGMLEGKLEGMLEGKLETAKAMIADGIPFETAAKYSGMPVDELRARVGSGIPQQGGDAKQH
jgi:predicted transposase/invertase (TIGR01784 family)